MSATAGNDRQDVLLELLRKRDEAGMRYLFDHYGGALNNIIGQIIPERQVAEEVLQDVLMRIWGNIHQYEEGKSRLFTWMARIARNAAIDRVRSKAYRKSGKTDELDVVVINRSNSETMSVEHIGLSKLITKLDENYRSIIDLLYFKDYTQAEAAEALDLPLGTVKTRSRRALQKLREILKSELITLLICLFNFLR
ncbi:RNA polymerase sigma-70 factor (ECF subfamily) [Lewinella marina]|uniref:RNA polymerase subunit sigma-70 n=1 Tax=Neolewinella marina TaxID=438751 RepID=A0A2G0CI08_9BACT|nr:RNA polymerase sigma factor [Neolewinella marina]NJB85255.1 RNA polymerase sigma-70 factor (ECF subfamily) [Neolewinella marina]PHK99615.1 RNA polymerase subunit sigma-70 [Neolewinella marina]